MVSLFLPGCATPLAWPPFHQSQEVLPGLIQEVSPMALGGFRLTTMFDSTSRPGCSAIINTRQDDFTGCLRDHRYLRRVRLGIEGGGDVGVGVDVLHARRQPGRQGPGRRPR